MAPQLKPGARAYFQKALAWRECGMVKHTEAWSVAGIAAQLPFNRSSWLVFSLPLCIEIPAKVGFPKNTKVTLESQRKQTYLKSGRSMANMSGVSKIPKFDERVVDRYLMAHQSTAGRR
ncbi:MAG: hypothetical protein IH604_09895 [Burkholderiales bacterium]|nr:hypothetical protein [Burkholderiales bacterium]